MAIVIIKTQNDADFFRSFVLQTTDGMPIDLTGTTMEMMLRRHAKDEAAVLRLATDTGEIVFTDPRNGGFSVRIVQTRLVRLGIGDFDQSNILTRADGSKYRVWSGTLTNYPGPTR
jgi:hypothetical protein